MSIHDIHQIRRDVKVDEAILGAYLDGANTRRIRKAAANKAHDSMLTKSISRYDATRGRSGEVRALLDENMPRSLVRLLG